MSGSISSIPGLCLAVILLLTSTTLVEPSRIKIHTYQPSSINGNRFLRQTTTTACDDRQAVDRSSLNLVGLLSMLNERVQFFRSNSATQRIDGLLSSQMVVGLDMVSAAMVLDVLRSEGCPVYIFGGIVRDQFLGVDSNDVDVEVDCSIETVVGVCRRNWEEEGGEEVCGSNNPNITHIGRKKHPLAIDLAPTNGTFYDGLTNLEYTANSLAYDLNGRNVVLDIPGNGVEDVCARKIRIPSDDGSQSSWLDWYMAERDGTKLYRYWKLRFKGFTALNSATSDFITTEVKRLIETDNPRGKGFKKFYCKTVFDSSYNNTCMAASEEVCQANSGKAMQYNMLLVEDLGEVYVQTLQLPTCTASGATSTSLSLGLTLLVFLALTLITY